MHIYKPSPILKKGWGKLILFGILPFAVYAIKNALQSYHNPNAASLAVLLDGSPLPAMWLQEGIRPSLHWQMVKLYC